MVDHSRCVDPDDLAGVAEAAQILGVPRNALCNLAQRDPRFPEEITRFAMGPVYSREDLANYGKSSNLSTMGCSDAP